MHTINNNCHLVQVKSFKKTSHNLLAAINKDVKSKTKYRFRD